MAKTIYVLKVFLSFIASFLHCVGFWALWNVKQTNPYLITQRLYLLHLSLSENVHSFFLGVYYTLTIYGKPKWANYAFICAGGGAFIWYLLIMIMLTVDRFLTVYLNVRYLSVWNVRKTKRVLAACFLVGFCFNIWFLISMPTFDISLERFSVYLWFPVDNIFTILACLTYIYIFRRVYQPSRGANNNSSNNTLGNRACAYTVSSQNHDEIPTSDLTSKSERRSTPSALPVIPNSKPKFPMRTFIIPLLLISTFIIFIGFPDNTYFWYFVLDKEVPPALDTLFFIFYPTGIMSDAIIYVLFAKDVRTFLFGKLGIRFGRNVRHDSQNTLSTSVDYRV